VSSFLLRPDCASLLGLMRHPVFFSFHRVVFPLLGKTSRRNSPGILSFLLLSFFFCFLTQLSSNSLLLEYRSPFARAVFLSSCSICLRVYFPFLLLLFRACLPPQCVYPIGNLGIVLVLFSVSPPPFSPNQYDQEFLRLLRTLEHWLS